MKRIILKTAFVLFTVLFSSSLQAEVTKVEIKERKTILQGKEFGKHGAYEYIKGLIYFEVDPKNPNNQQITDIEFAPLNANGMVEFYADFEVLQPISTSENANETALVEVSNRGGKFSLRYFNRSTSRTIDVNDEKSFGDNLLMENGLTVIWLGWQFDVPDDDQTLNIYLPNTVEVEGKPISGLVRSDWTLNQTTNTLSLGHRNQTAYAVSDKEDKRNVLTVRDGRDAERKISPKSKWTFAKEVDGELSESNTHIYMKEAFQAGKIYEMVYVSENPVIVGLGMAAIRDVIDYAKYNKESIFPVEKAIAAGVSQTGRFLRHFVYQDFNVTESGKQAYDGLMIITAGAGRGSFNHRFAQPSRDAHRYSAFFYPTDIFPFTSRTQTDPINSKEDGLVQNATKNALPKIMYINTGYEYWGRAASLIHMSVDGEKDISPMENERIYHLASGQHYVNGFPPRENNKISALMYRGNHLDYSVNYRSLLLQLKAWVNGMEPPQSKYPKIAEQTLVSIDKLNYPKIDGFQKSKVIHNAYRADYGNRFTSGIVDIQPPVLESKYPVKVAQVDEFGNEKAGIRNVELTVPIATYIPWNLRKDMPGEENELTDFLGTFIPFQMEKKYSDERPLIEMLYSSKVMYLEKVQKAIDDLVEAGFVLKIDEKYILNRAVSYWDYVVEGH